MYKQNIINKIINNKQVIGINIGIIIKIDGYGDGEIFIIKIVRGKIQQINNNKHNNNLINKFPSHHQILIN